MKRILKILLLVILVIAAIFLCTNFYPVKWSVTRQQLDDRKDYILVEPYLVTVAPWKIIEDKNGKYDDYCAVRLVGNEPNEFNSSVDLGHNIFVCYGKFLEDGNLAGETYKVFEVENWDILFPIKRNSIFSPFMPKSFLCKADIQ